MKKVGMVLEGGAMRGMYTAGVLDVLLENNIHIDEIVGVSAGALFGVNYFSKQKGRALRYSKKYCKDLRYISLLSLILTGNIVNKNFAYYKVSEKLDKFDDDTYKKCKSNFYAVISNIENGKPEYINIKSCYEQMEVLRASSAMPLVTKPVKINNNLYLDGAVTDSIPVLKLKDKGFKKIIVVLTRPLSYRKENLSPKTIKRITKKYKKYPKLVEAMIKRPSKYNEILEKIIDMENKQEIFVLRPSEPINIKVVERNKNKLQKIYDLGVTDTKNNLKKLYSYLEK